MKRTIVVAASLWRIPDAVAVWNGRLNGWLDGSAGERVIVLWRAVSFSGACVHSRCTILRWHVCQFRLR